MVNSKIAEQDNIRNMTYMVKQFDELLPPQKASQDFTSPYNDKVLCGNWQENSSKYVRIIHPVESLYMKEYNKLKVEKRIRNDYYNIKFKGWGVDWHTLNDQGKGGEFYGNFSTLYDLSYNSPCPQLTNKPMRKFHCKMNQYRPQQDMMLNYGNTVDYGLRKCKEKVWEDEMLHDIGDMKTTSQVTYVPPQLPPFYKRRSPYKKISSSFCKIATMNPDLKIKDKNLWICNDIPPELVLFSKKRKPNKILPTL